MVIIRKALIYRVKVTFKKILDDNLFLLASSVSYYAALALAPFLLILLWAASLLGHNIQKQIINHVVENFSPDLGEVVNLIFQNITESVNIGSISGVVGFVVLLWTCSIVFLQLRYSFDIIYGYHLHPDFKKNIIQMIGERFFAMITVLLGIILLIMTFAVTAYLEFFWARALNRFDFYRFFVFVMNFLIYMILFTALHKFTPTRPQKLKSSIKVASISSIFFIFGNWALAYYLKSVAANSVYGAAGTLLIFLIWSYYSSFIVFLSVEVKHFFK